MNTHKHSVKKSKQQKTECYVPCADLALMSATELIKLKPPKARRHWGKLIQSQQCGMLVGPRGKGKTWFSLALAIAMASGSDFLGHAPKKKRKVVYLDGEMTLGLIQQRIELIAKGINVKVPSTLKIFTPDLFDDMLPSVSDVEGQLAIDAMLADDFDVLIVDNYSVWSKGGNESAEAFQPVMKWMLNHKRRGKTVILVHHTGKSGKQRGSSKHEDALDFSITLQPDLNVVDSSKLSFVVGWTKLRHLPQGQAPTLAVTMQTSEKKGAQWSHDTVKSETERKELALMMKRSGNSLAEIAKKMEVNKSTVSRWLKSI